LERVHEQGKRIEAVVKKLMELRQYSTKTYLNNIEMIDLSVQMLKESQAEK
jgi:hypothetical protein